MHLFQSAGNLPILCWFISCLNLEMISNSTSIVGFGSSQTDMEFKSKIRKLLEEYTSSHNPYDLIFTPDFSSEQRATIHK